MASSGEISRISTKMILLFTQVHINTMKTVQKAGKKMKTLMTCVWLTGGVCMTTLQVDKQRMLFLWAIKKAGSQEEQKGQFLDIIFPLKMRRKWQEVSASCFYHLEMR